MRTYDNDTYESNKKSVVLIICVLVVIALIGFVAFRVFTSRNDTGISNNDTSEATVDTNSASESVTNKVTSVYNVSDKFYSEADESLNGANMQITYANVDSTTEFVGDGTHYRLVIVGQIRNAGDGEADVRALPDLVINGVKLTKSISVPSLPYKGTCEYKYVGVFDSIEALEGPYEIELPNDGLSKTYPRLWTVTGTDSFSGEVSGTLADGSLMTEDDYNKFISPVIFNGDITSNEVFMDGLGERLGGMRIYVSDGYGWDKTALNDYSFYEVIDTRGEVKGGKYHFEADIRNNLYHETFANVSFPVGFLDADGETVETSVLESDHKLKPGEVVTLSCVVDSTDISDFYFGEVDGFFDLEQLTSSFGF